MSVASIENAILMASAVSAAKTPAAPFTAQNQGVGPLSILLTRPIPVGKPKPIKMPAGMIARRPLLSKANNMAGNQSGKSGLAAALMAAGHPMLSDDVLPIQDVDGELRARSGYPQMRMWPDEAAHFGALADLHSARGEATRAIEAARTACELDPEDEEHRKRVERLGR